MFCANLGATLGPTVDPFYSSVKLLLHLDGTNGSTSIVDNSPLAQTCTARGNAKLSTAQVKFGSASLLLDGIGDDVLTVTNTAVGAGQFTFEAWVRPNAAQTGRIISAQNVITPNAAISLRVDSTGSVTFQLRDVSGAGLVVLTTATGLIAMNNTQWYFVAVTRNSSDLINIWINGTSRASTTSAADPNGLGNPYIVGSFDNNQEYFAGYLDDVRITEGVARYTANFLPPTAPFPNS